MNALVSSCTTWFLSVTSLSLEMVLYSDEVHYKSATLLSLLLVAYFLCLFIVLPGMIAIASKVTPAYMFLSAFLF